MRFRWCLGMSLGAAHLVLVICGASGCLPERSRGPLAQALRWYAIMSGASARFGYYAPAVGANTRARFLLRDEKGVTWSDTFDETKSPEVRLRLGGAEFAFVNGEAEKSPARRQRLVKSWAAAMFTRHPGAVSLTVVVEAYDVPTMAEHRAGLRPSWNLLYQARVHRASSAGQERIEP